MHHDIAKLFGGLFLWKNKIRGFWDVMVEMTYKGPKNEYYKILGARKFWDRWVWHMAKLVGAPRHM